MCEVVSVCVCVCGCEVYRWVVIFLQIDPKIAVPPKKVNSRGSPQVNTVLHILYT